jgi:predicted outer membrane repeat protein
MYMRGGIIRNNYCVDSGGGLVSVNNATVTMSGGESTGNYAESNGGGIHADNGNFFISGGVIGGNKAVGTRNQAAVNGGTVGFTPGSHWEADVDGDGDIDYSDTLNPEWVTSNFWDKDGLNVDANTASEVNKYVNGIMRVWQ